MWKRQLGGLGWGLGGSLVFLCLVVILDPVPFPLAVSQDQEMTVQTSLQSYTDNRNVFVFGPTVDLHKQLTDRTGLDLKLDVDVVSSASVSCSTCHKERQSWPRSEIVASVDHQVGETKLGLSYYFSREKDLSSDALTASISRDFLQGNSTVALRYTGSWDRIKPHGWREDGDKLLPDNKLLPKDDDGEEIYQDQLIAPGQTLPVDLPDLKVHTAALAFTQVLGRRTVAQVNYEFSYLSGYQQDPYHLLPIAGLDYFESHPDIRKRNAVAFRLKQAIGSFTTLDVGYRYYTDDWEIQSHTANLGVSRTFMEERLLLEVAYRFYTQTEASFYRPSYDSPKSFRTLDDRLGAFDAHYVRLGLALKHLGKGDTFLSSLGFRLNLSYYMSGASIIGNLSSGRRIDGSSDSLRAATMSVQLGYAF